MNNRLASGDALWQDYKTSLSERSAYQLAVAVLELEPNNPVLRDVVRRVSVNHRSEPALDWDRWVASVEKEGRGWSSSEWRFYDMAAALASDRPLRFRGTFDCLGHYLEPVLEILRQYGADSC